MPIEHTIAPGDSTIRLSEEHGFFADTIWNDPANAELKQKRKDMNVLMPGDVLVIPDRKEKEVSKPDGRKHTFKRKGVPAKFRLQVFDVEKPRANQSYQLDVDGKLLKGKTDGEGVLEEYVPPGARGGVLIIGDDHYTVEIDFGFLDPISELVGVQQRLLNLGYDCGDVSGQMSDQTRSALREFQKRFALKETGTVNDETRQKIEEVHDNPKQFPKS